jgi:hypothetical protein
VATDDPPETKPPNDPRPSPVSPPSPARSDDPHAGAPEGPADSELPSDLTWPWWVRPLLIAFADSGNMTEACRRIGVERSTPDHWVRRRLANDDAAMRAGVTLFLDLYEAARVEGRERLEVEARRRAVEGWEEPVFGSLGQGQGTGQVGSIRRYSDTLLIRLLEAHWPERYRPRMGVDVRGQLDHRHTVRSEIDAELAELAARFPALDAALPQLGAGGPDGSNGAGGSDPAGADRQPGDVSDPPAYPAP